MKKYYFIVFLCNDKRRHLFSVEAVPEDVHGDVEEVERTPGEEEHHTHLKGWQCAVLDGECVKYKVESIVFRVCFECCVLIVEW